MQRGRGCRGLHRRGSNRWSVCAWGGPWGVEVLVRGQPEPPQRLGDGFGDGPRRQRRALDQQHRQAQGAGGQQLGLPTLAARFWPRPTRCSGCAAAPGRPAACRGRAAPPPRRAAAAPQAPARRCAADTNAACAAKSGCTCWRPMGQKRPGLAWPAARARRRRGRARGASGRRGRGATAGAAAPAAARRPAHRLQWRGGSSARQRGAWRR